MTLPKEYWQKKQYDLEDKMLALAEQNKCAGCGEEMTFIFSYKIPESDFIAKICGCCMNRYDGLDRWNIID